MEMQDWQKPAKSEVDYHCVEATRGREFIVRLTTGADPVKALDVSILQDQVLEPLFGIQDPKTDERIAFVGGIRGLDALKVMADKTGGVAFSMYPTSMDELLSVADAGLLMPPKSTWFEPKLKSGIFIHEIEK